MNPTFSRITPEVMFSSVTGPGLATADERLPMYMYIVYAFPSFIYLRAHDAYPRVNHDEISQRILENLPANLRSRIRAVFPCRDDDFLRRCWDGALWPVMSLLSPTGVCFTSAGMMLKKNVGDFITREAVSHWIKKTPARKTHLNADMACGALYANETLNLRLVHALPKEQSQKTGRILTDLKYAKQQIQAARDLYDEKATALGARGSWEQMQDLLVAMRVTS